MSGFGRILRVGVIAAATTALAGGLAFRSIAEDVAGRAAERLKLDGRGWAKVAIDGRDVTLTGTAPEPDDRRLAVEATDRVFGVRIVDDRTTVLPLASPYAWAIEKTDASVVLAGAVPGDEARADLRSRAATALLGATITDSTTPARGAPADWRTRSDFALAVAADLKTGTVSWSGDELSVTGDPRDFPAWDSLRRRLAGALPPGTRLGEVKLTTPAPPLWSVSLTRSADRVVIEGFLPDEATADRVKAAAGSVGTIDDRAIVAPGAEPGTGEALDFALKALAGLEEGGVKIDPAGFSIAGHPKSREVWRDLESQLKAGVPGGLPLVADGLVPVAPSPWRFELVGTDGSVEASGFVPDAATGDRIAAALAANFASVKNRLEPAPGAPAGLGDAVLAVIPTLSRFGRFDFATTDATASLTAAAPTEALGRQIATKLAGLLPKGFTLASPTIGALPPPPQESAVACEADLARVQSGQKILFDTGEATLKEDGVRVLDALVVASLKCLAAHVTVEGHTDSEGEEAANRTLSEERARAVVDYLVAAGIAANRLTAVGFGESRPIADNATEDGRRENRRIEFRVE